MASKVGYSSGIDWMEVTVLMNAIEALHGVGVSLAMSLDGAYKPYRMQVVAIAVKNNPTSTVVTRSVSRRRFYPSSDAKSMAGLCFRLLHELDADCGTMWEQKSFT